MDKSRIFASNRRNREKREITQGNTKELNEISYEKNSKKNF